MVKLDFPDLGDTAPLTVNVIYNIVIGSVYGQLGYVDRRDICVAETMIWIKGYKSLTTAKIKCSVRSFNCRLIVKLIRWQTIFSSKSFNFAIGGGKKVLIRY